jgi:hypothetical protein
VRIGSVIASCEATSTRPARKAQSTFTDGIAFHPPGDRPRDWSLSALFAARRGSCVTRSALITLVAGLSCVSVLGTGCGSIQSPCTQSSAVPSSTRSERVPDQG